MYLPFYVFPDQASTSYQLKGSVPVVNTDTSSIIITADMLKKIKQLCEGKL